MIVKKILFVASIIFCVIAVVALVSGLWLFISSRMIDPADDMYGESRGWGQILGFFVIIIGIISAIIGVLGLVFYKKRYGGIYFIIVGVILFCSQISSAITVISAIYLIIPVIYVVCGILLLIHNSKKPQLESFQNSLQDSFK